MVFGVSGYDVCPEERVAYQEQDITKIAQSVGVQISKAYMGITGPKLNDIIDHPSAEPYYKQRRRGGCKDILFLSTLDKVEHFVNVMADVAEHHAYPMSDLGTYIQPILFGRACHIEFSLYFNPEDRTEVENIHSLFLMGSEALSRAGAFFSRPYGYWSELAYARCPDTVIALKKVKSIFDPENILNQGKLVFTEDA